MSDNNDIETYHYPDDNGRVYVYALYFESPIYEERWRLFTSESKVKEFIKKHHLENDCSYERLATDDMRPPLIDEFGM